MTKSLPDMQMLHELLSYNPLTGELTWKYKTMKHCASEREMNRWNGRHGGKDVRGKPNSNGYYTITIDSISYLQHRIIWKMVYGTEPPFIDHEDGITANNKLINLKAATRRENNVNAKKRKDNSSNVTGVSYHKIKQKWTAYINDNGKRINLGDFLDINDAIAARKLAEIQYGYHANHGR